LFFLFHSTNKIQDDKMTMNNRRFATVLGVLCVSSSCAIVRDAIGITPKRDGREEVRVASKNKDEVKLRALCADDSLGSLDNGPRQVACYQLQLIEMEKDTGDCATVAARFKVVLQSTSKDGLDYYSEWAGRVLKCEQYDVIFEQFAHLGEGSEHQA